MTRRRAVVAVAALACLALAGCASEVNISRGGQISGKTLTVYSSLPAPGEVGSASADIVAGEKLALMERGGRAGAYAVNFASIDEAADGDAERTAAAARRVLEDTQSIAVIGGSRTAETRITAPLFNAAGLLQVAVGAGFGAFTRDPAPYEPSARQTFARAAGDDRVEATAIVAAALDPAPRASALAGDADTAPGADHEGGALAGADDTTLLVEAEGSAAGRALADLVRSVAVDAGARLTTRPERADAAVYTGEDPVAAAGVLQDLEREAPGATLIVPDALARQGVGSGLGDTARLIVATAPAPTGFAARFRQAFGRAPGPYAALGHAAMTGVLDAIAAAGEGANRRQDVIDAYFAGGMVEPTGERRDPAFAVLATEG